MIRFACGRLFSGVPVGRSLQQTTRATNCTRSALQMIHSQASSVLMTTRLPTTSRLLSITPVSWSSSRLCHGDSSRSPDKEDGFSMRALTQAPKPALILGLSGLIPFLSTPMMMASAQCYIPQLALAQMLYGACIVSFLGGARWGFAIPHGSPAQPDWKNLGNSVVPSLLAWLALLCRDNIAEGAMLVIMGLGLTLHYDLTLLPGYPPWFKALRTILTLVATFTIVATLAFQKFYPQKSIKELQG